MSNRNLVVIGGGAAGFFCAVNAARLHPGLEVVLLEKSNKLLRKVKVSGGGRCNVTHACFDIGEMSKRYPRGNNFIRKTFYQFFTTDTIEWFEQRGVKLKTEPDGRMFPVSDSSQTIIDCLLNEARKYGVKIILGAEVKSVKRNVDKFELAFDDSGLAPLQNPDYLCIASGGYPKSSQFDWIKATGHSIVDPVPSLFTFNMPRHPITELMGVVVEKARVKISGTNLVERGPLLITHWGLSGPVILRLSAWGAHELATFMYDFNIQINWLENQGYNESMTREAFAGFRDLQASQKIVNYNFAELPKRVWQFLLNQSGVTEEMRFGDLNRKTENTLIRNLIDYPVSVKGKTTFKEEFVTAGGVKLSEVDANSMKSKKVPGLFFAGEILDVDGITGGFNFQHAWTSGFVAAKSIASSE